jgi:hypothetical protein
MRAARPGRPPTGHETRNAACSEQHKGDERPRVHEPFASTHCMVHETVDREGAESVAVELLLAPISAKFDRESGQWARSAASGRESMNRSQSFGKQRRHSTAAARERQPRPSVLRTIFGRAVSGLCAPADASRRPGFRAGTVWRISAPITLLRLRARALFGRGLAMTGLRSFCARTAAQRAKPATFARLPEHRDHLCPHECAAKTIPRASVEFVSILCQ